MDPKPKILIVDDDASARTLIKVTLAKRDYEIIEATSGEETLEIFNNKEQSIDVMILDVRMPNMDGFEILAALKDDDKLENTKVLMVSGQTNTETKIRAFASGASDYVVKPFVLDELIARVNVLAKVKQSEKELQRQEEKYRTIFENSAVAIMVTDEQERIISWNSLAEDLMGMDRDDLYLKPIKSLYPEKEWERIRAQNIRHKGMEHHMETQVIKKNQEIIDVDISISVLKGPDGEVTGSIGVLSDITERKRMEEQIRLAEEKYRTIFENSAVAITVTDEQERIISWNNLAEDLMGMDRDDLYLKPIKSLYPEKEWERIRAQNIRRKGMEHHMETQVIKKNQEIIDVDISISVLKGPDGEVTGSIGVLSDITERKKAQEELERKEEYFRAIIEDSSDGIVVISSDGTFTYESPSMERILGIKPEDRIGHNLLELVHPDDMDKAAKGFSQLLKKPGAVLDVEIRVNHSDGSTHILEVNGKNLIDNPVVNGVVANFRDITERKAMENELRESEERLHSYLENSPDVICVINLEGIITYINGAAERVIGYTRNELIGKNFMEAGIVAPVDVQKPTQWMENREAERYVGATEMELIKKDGTHIFVEASSFPMLSTDESKPTEIISIIRDVTDRNTMEKQLLLAGRLAAVGELAAGVAHELNNPLTSIQGFSQFLARNADLDNSVKDDIEIIYQEAQRATKITANLLSFARKHEPEKKSMSINEAIEQSVELNAYRMKVNNVEIETELEPDLPSTLGDFHQLEQVFVNIMNNAEHAMTEAHGGGKIIIKSESINNIIRISFIDNGPGMSENDIKRVFDPFYTTKDVGKGTGLGLSICFGIIESHNGSLHAINNADQGATFIVELPITTEDQYIEEYNQGQIT